MSDTDGMVVFEMPDGTKVSNDPRFDLAKALEEHRGNTPNTGTVGPSVAEHDAQVRAEVPATLNSGQPGVGPNAAPDPMDYVGPTGTPAMQTQKDDLKAAQEAGADITNTSVQDPEPYDSNEAVLKVREDLAAAREKVTKSAEKLSEKEKTEGDPNTPYEEWDGDQLKHEVNKRNADETRAQEDVIDLAGITKKSEVAALLTADDERQKQQNTGGANQP